MNSDYRDRPSGIIPIGRAARSWRSALLLVSLTMLAAFFRFWRLDGIPPGFHFDEAYEALEAWQVLSRPGYHPIFFTGNFGVDPMFIYLTSLAFRLFGAEPLVMRGVAALAGALTVPALYAMLRELRHLEPHIPPAAPWLAAAALALMRWHVHYSRVGIEPILVPLFLVLILWAFALGLRTNRPGAWLAFGLATGLGFYTYPAGRLLPGLAFILAVMALLWPRRSPAAGSAGNARGPRLTFWAGRRPLLPGLALAGIVALLVIAPIGTYFLQHPDQFLLRSSQIAVGPEGVTQGDPLANTLATLRMFTLHGDLDPRNNLPGLPALDWLVGVPFYMGAALALWGVFARPRQTCCEAQAAPPGLAFAALFAAGLVMLSATIFSDYAPHFRRAVGATPVVACLIGLGLATIWQMGVPLSATLRGYLPPVLVLLLLAGSAYLAADAYFRRWGESADVYYAYDEGLWEIGEYVLNLPDDELVFVSPRPATDMTLAFAWREGRPVRHFDGRHAFVVPAGTEGKVSAPAAVRDTTYVIIEHEDYRGAGLLQSLFPEAKEIRRFRDRNGGAYARAFAVPAGARPARGPQHRLDVTWPGVKLIGYDLDKTVHRPGETFYLQLWWRATGRAGDWTVFTHLLGPERPDGSRVWAGQDARPGQGSAAMPSWSPGDLVLDEYQLHVPPDTPAGEYAIDVGLYDPAAGGARILGESPPGIDHVVVAQVRVE